LLKGLFREVAKEDAITDEAAMEFLARYRFDPEPITYAATLEGGGAYYELRIPRRLLMRAFSEIGAREIATRMPRNESIARSMLSNLVELEKAYKQQHNRFANLDELEGAEFLKGAIERYGYRVEVTATGSGFQATLTPLEYGKTARLSFFTDETGVEREGDHNGKPASSSDKAGGRPDRQK
jgi:hypothetical protein